MSSGLFRIILGRTTAATRATTARIPAVCRQPRPTAAGGARRRLIEPCGIDWIRLCASVHARTYFSNPGGARAALYRRLAAGQPPEWLSRVALPAELAGNFRLYQVIGAP